MSDAYKAYSKSLYSTPKREAKRPTPPPVPKKRARQQMEVVRPTNPMGSF